MYGIIYLTTNKINNHKYIGQHRCDNKDFDGYLGSGIAITNAIKKYGKENFTREILACGNSREELNKLEEYFIKLYKADVDPNFYNIAKGGGGVSLNRKEMEAYHNKNFLIKMSEVTKGENNGMYGKKHSIKSKEAMSKKKKGKNKGSKNGNFGNKGSQALNGTHYICYLDKDKTQKFKEFVSMREVLSFLGIKAHSVILRAIRLEVPYRNYYWERKKKQHK